VTPIGPALTEEERRHLDGAVDALARRYEGLLSRETVERCVDESLASFRDARITVHLPVLVERVARQRLQALTGRELASA
jgi:arsenate reductase (thioredoxin)